MLTFVADEWARVLSTGAIGAAVGTALGGALTVIGKGFWVRWIEEHTLSCEQLLERLESGKLTKQGRKRLQGEGREMLNCWRRALPVPPGGRKLSTWSPGPTALHVRPFSEADNDTACPIVHNGASPLFLDLGAEMSSALTEQLQLEFERLDQVYKSSKVLISQLSLPSTEMPTVWIRALNLLIRERREAEDLLQKLSREIKKVMPAAAVVLELYASSELTPLKSEQGSLLDVVVPVRPAARYAFFRNSADEFLKGRAFLGNLRLPDKLVPNSLIEARLEGVLKPAAADFSTWRTVVISGPPGSGKSEVANAFLQQIPASSPVLVLTGATVGILAALRSLPEQVTTTHMQEALAKAVCEDAVALIPAEFRTSHDWELPFSDALIRVLSDPQHHVLIVLDDAHTHVDVMPSVNRLRTTASPFRFLLIGRSRMPQIHNEQLVSYECSLWDDKDAAHMLRSWVSVEHHIQINPALQHGWPARQSAFSLYLLRSMAEYIDSLEDAPSELLRKAITQHISPISELLTLEQEPAGIVLERVKALLAKPDLGRRDLISALESRTALDPALVLGILAWHTNFSQSEFSTTRTSQGAFLQAQRVVQFSRGLVPSKEVAEQLLEAGARAKIFDRTVGAFSNVYGWSDKLVADGCAALYLAHEIVNQNMDDGSIASCLECLHQQNSLDILALAVDVELLLRIIKAISVARPNLAHVVNSLLTAEIVGRLAQTPGCLEDISQELFEMSAIGDLGQLPDASAALQRVMSSSEQVRSQCWHFIRSAASRYALPALAVVATQHMDNEQFFEEVKARQIDNFMLPVALDAAARIWTSNGWVQLSVESAKLLGSNVPRRQIENAWKNWLQRQSPSDCMQVSLRFMQAASHADPESMIFLAEIVLKHVVTTASPKQRQDNAELFRDIGTQLKALAASNLRKEAADIVKWLAISYAPDLVDRNHEWILTHDGTLAFTKDSLDTDSIKDLFSRLSKVRPRFRLPSSRELKALAFGPSLELIRDGFDDQFSYDEELLPGQIQAWDGSKVVVLQKWQIRSQAFAWRPRFDIPS